MGERKRYRFLFSFRFAIIFITLAHVTVIPGVAFSSLNFALVCMVNRTYLYTSHARDNETNVHHCKVNSAQNRTDSTEGTTGTFFWDKTVQSNLLAAYSWGAIFVVFLAGWLCDQLGSKVVMLVSCAVSTIAVTLTPVAATYGGWIAVFVDRIVIGFGAACSWPAIGKVAAQWSGPNERATVMAIPSSGFALGAFVTNLSAGFICSNIGWEAVFYAAGIIGLIYFVILFIFFSSDPADSRWISEAEKQYITGDRGPPPIRPKTPWLPLLTSLSVIIIVINGYAERTIQFFVMLFLPTYFSEAFDEQVQTNGIYSAIPFIAQIIGRIGSGILADRLKFSQNETINTKVYNTAAFVSVGLLLLGITFLTCSQAYLVTVLMAFQYFLGGMVLAGYMKAALLIAPPFVGAIMGLNTTGAFLAAVLMPYIVGPITINGTLGAWKNAVYFVIAVVAFGAVTYVIFGSAERQKWSLSDKQSGAKVAPMQPAPTSFEMVENENQKVSTTTGEKEA